MQEHRMLGVLDARKSILCVLRDTMVQASNGAGAEFGNHPEGRRKMANLFRELIILEKSLDQTLGDLEMKYRYHAGIAATAIRDERKLTQLGIYSKSTTSIQFFEKIWVFYQLLDREDTNMLVSAGVTREALVQAKQETEVILTDIVQKVYNLLDRVQGYAVAA